MEPSEIRIKLLAQHTHLRSLIDDVRNELDSSSAMVDFDVAKRRPDRLRSAMVALALGVRDHNDEEELLLRDVISTVDAWGPVRAEIMGEQHIREHRELCSAVFDTAGSVDTREASALLDRLLKHMAIEENIMLDESVLRDDSVVIDAFSG
jgi:hemerythrin HHE cation binding domain-containing protein